MVDGNSNLFVSGRVRTADELVAALKNENRKTLTEPEILQALVNFDFRYKYAYSEGAGLRARLIHYILRDAHGAGVEFTYKGRPKLLAAKEKK